jgi:uncharacterized membrane protein
MLTLRRLGQCFYGIALIAFGVQQVVYREFVTRAVPWWPSMIPGHAVWALIIGALLIAAGLAMLLDVRARSTAIVTGMLLLLSFLGLGLPLAIPDIMWGGRWTSAMKALALSGGALMIAGSLRRERWGSPFISAIEPLVPAGRFFLAAFLILAGIQHFVWHDLVATLVPAWIPRHLFWTYFAGVALIAGGLGLMLRPTVRPAARLVGLVIFTWVLTLHIPRALADLHNANETTAVFEALAFSGVAFVLAATSSRTREM